MNRNPGLEHMVSGHAAHCFPLVMLPVFTPITESGLNLVRLFCKNTCSPMRHQIPQHRDSGSFKLLSCYPSSELFHTNCRLCPVVDGIRLTQRQTLFKYYTNKGNRFRSLTHDMPSGLCHVASIRFEACRVRSCTQWRRPPALIKV